MLNFIKRNATNWDSIKYSSLEKEEISEDPLPRQSDIYTSPIRKKIKKFDIEFTTPTEESPTPTRLSSGSIYDSPPRESITRKNQPPILSRKLRTNSTRASKSNSMQTEKNQPMPEFPSYDDIYSQGDWKKYRTKEGKPFYYNTM